MDRHNFQFDPTRNPLLFSSTPTQLPQLITFNMKISCLFFIVAIPSSSAFTISGSKGSSSALYSSYMPGYGQKVEQQQSTQQQGYTFPQASNPLNVADSRQAGPITGSFGTRAAAPLSEPQQQPAKTAFQQLAPITVQGGSLRTWSFATAAIERVQVILTSDGRPLHANVELWQGPDNTPVKLAVYNEDGSLRPFSAVIETPRGQNAIAIRNTGQMEFPLTAAVEADLGKNAQGLGAITKKLAESASPRVVQGGAVQAFPFDASVASVQIMLKTDGRPLNARIELLQGPNNNKQVIDLYTEDGLERPFFAIIETPGSGNVVRLINTAPLEFPLTARIEPYLMENVSSRGNDSGEFFILDRQL